MANPKNTRGVTKILVDVEEPRDAKPPLSLEENQLLWKREREAYTAVKDLNSPNAMPLFGATKRKGGKGT